MSKTKDYFPKADDTLAIYLNTFNNKLAQYAAILRLAAADVTQIQRDNTNAVNAIQRVDGVKLTLKNEITTKNALTSVAEKGVRKASASIKTNPNYTEAIGRDMGIIGEDSMWDSATAQPVLKASLNGGAALLDFEKAQSTGVGFWGRRGPETAFTFLAHDTHPPYVDNRPNLVAGVREQREYYGFYMVDDQQVGQQSAIVSITV